MHFRTLRKKDFPRIREIATESWIWSYDYLPAAELTKLVSKYYSDKSLEKSFENVKAGKDCFVVAEINKKSIGFIHAGMKGTKKGELYRFYLEIDYIGKGIGKQLLQRAEKFLKSKGCKKYFTFANKHGKRAPEFYMWNGFQRVPEKDEYDEFKKYGKVLWCLEKEL
ncbi:MAG: GNAT family N-acetyltransferase [Candidatus Aenigmarchaeota archaeon]|nr:GNAT family N-acetyltransferase [Candidatus Aenigmarchaeota archaeon]